jgi:hypothetical protein
LFLRCCHRRWVWEWKLPASWAKAVRQLLPRYPHSLQALIWQRLP